jgi:hypothetical protein
MAVCPFNGDYRGLIQDVVSGKRKVFRVHDSTNQLEDDNDMIAVGGIYLSAVNTDPGLPQVAGGLGYGSWSRIAHGKAIVGLDETDTDFQTAESTTGTKTRTPTGTVSQPSFTGTSSQATSAVSAGTPSGTVSQPTFTGTTSQATSAVSAGTPEGTVSQPTFTGNALATHTHTFTGNAMAGHAHELPLQLVSGTSTRHLPAATFGTGTSRAAQGADTATANTTSAAVALSQNVSAGTPSGTNAAISAGTPTGIVSQPTFTGSALGNHSHTITPGGTVSQPAFSGNLMANHSHTITPSGIVSQPTFTGNTVSVVQPSIALYIWKRIS